MALKNEQKKYKPNITVNKSKDYPFAFTAIDNRHCNNKYNLSTNALILLFYMLSRSHGWFFNKTDALKTTGLSSQSFVKAKKELIDKNFLICKIETKTGRYTYEYTVFECPYDLKHEENENQYTENNMLNSKPANEDVETSINININNKKQIKNTNDKDKTYNQIKDLAVCDNPRNIKPAKKIYKKNIEEIFSFVDKEFIDSEVNNTFKSFISDQYEKGKLFSETRYNTLAKKLRDLSGDTNEQIKIINNAIEHSWNSFFPLKKSDDTLQNNKVITFRKNGSKGDK